MTARAPKCFADMIVEWGQTTEERSGEELALLEAVSWLAWDIINCRAIPSSLRETVLGYKSARDRSVRTAIVAATVEMAHAAGHPKSLAARRGTESAFEVASRIHGTTPTNIRKQAAKKRRAPSKR
jgi:hypothetical protein